MIKLLHTSLALPAERLHHGVDIYILQFHGLMGQSTVNIAKCLYVMLAVYYIYEVLSLQYATCNKL